MTSGDSELLASLDTHVTAVVNELERIREQLPVVARWGAELGERLSAGGRLLVCGNGGSAAQAQHLAAELVGRFSAVRPGLSAFALASDGPLVTALANDFGVESVFARQVEAHGRGGDVLLTLSTSGRSPDLLEAVAAAARCGVRSWALTGSAPNPLAGAADEAVTVDARSAATIQEVHQVLVHVLAEAVDVAVTHCRAAR